MTRKRVLIIQPIHESGLALLAARDLFWRHGYDGTGIRQLEEGLGIGRKSLYDTFGSKRELFHAALERYGRTVIQRICDSLRDDARDGWSNLERVLDPAAVPAQLPVPAVTLEIKLKF